MQTLNIKIQGQEIYWENSFPIVAGSEEYLYCNFKYNNDWDNSVKQIRFYNPDSKKKYYEIPKPDELVEIPSEVVVGKCFYITVGGYNDGTFIPTSALKIPLQKNEFGEPDEGLGGEGEETPSELVEILLESAQKCEEAYDQLMEAEKEREEEFVKFIPQIGENGNWYVYNLDTKQYEDSGTGAVITTNKVDYGEV